MASYSAKIWIYAENEDETQRIADEIRRDHDTSILGLTYEEG